MNKILIVDDDYAIRTLYEEELTEEGYKVITFGDCEGLFETLEEERPHLIIMDIRMGECNGLDIRQDIRNKYYDLPIILCTALPVFKYDPKSAAADFYVVKRSDLSELKLKIKMAMDGGLPFEQRTTDSGLMEATPFQIMRK